MGKQLYLNNFETAFAAAVKDTPVTGSPLTELGYGILNLNNSTAAALANPTGGDFYMLTALKRSGSVEAAIEIMKVTAVDTTTYPGECRVTVTRAQEGTTAQAYLVGDIMSLRWTKGAANSMIQGAEKDASGGVPGLTLFKLNLRNAANTVTSWFTTVATVARTWTLPDKDGTVAMTSDITVSLTGSETLTNKTLTGLKETRVAVAESAIDLAAGNVFTKTAASALTWTVTNTPATGTAVSFILDLTNGGAYVQTWWSGVKWAGGVAPILTAAGRDALGFYTHDGGTTWTGLVLGKDIK